MMLDVLGVFGKRGDESLCLVISFAGGKPKKVSCQG
jgi:hypothetical protein